MIADNGANGKKRPIVVAVEDAIVVFMTAFLAQLLAALPGLPTGTQLYAAALIGATFGLGAWAKARNVQVPASR